METGWDVWKSKLDTLFSSIMVPLLSSDKLRAFRTGLEWNDETGIGLSCASRIADEDEIQLMWCLASADKRSPTKHDCCGAWLGQEHARACRRQSEMYLIPWELFSSIQSCSCLKDRTSFTCLTIASQQQHGVTIYIYYWTRRHLLNSWVTRSNLV